MSDFIRKYDSAQSRHTHDDFHQIIIPVTGQLELDIQGRQGFVGTRTIGVVSQGETHAFRADEGNQFLVLDIPHENTDDSFNPIWDQAVDKPFHTMSEALLSLTDYAIFCSQKKMSQDWLNTWQKLFLQTISCELQNDLPALPSRIQNAITYMEQNIGRPISNTDLADVSCISPARFYEIFRQSTGITPQQYLTHCRLEAAKKLIFTGKSLAEASSEVGFSDQSSFGRAFRNAYDLSPGQWRDQEFKTKQS